MITPGSVQKMPGGQERYSPNDLAMLILRDHQILHETSSGSLYEYNGQHWERITERDIYGYACQYDPHEHTKRTRRAEAAAYIADTSLKRRIEWRKLEMYEVPLHDGVLDLRDGSIRPHRPEDYLETVIPHANDAAAQCPRWMEALDQYFGGDADCDAKIAALQEFAGYCLMTHARYKKALVCYGESDTGKSVIPWCIREMVGSTNACSVSVEDMDDPMKRTPLIGRMVNLLTELTSDSVIADGGFKTLISTEEPVSIRRLYIDAFEYVPIAKHVICTNVLPAINDKSKATFNRLLLIKFNRVLSKEEQDRHIWDRLKAEMPGILQWAIEGARRLYQADGNFTAVGESETAVREYRERENPVFEFIEERCVREEPGAPLGDVLIPSTEFRDKFGAWLGRRVTPKECSSLLRSAGFQIQPRTNPRTGKSARSVVSLWWRD